MSSVISSIVPSSGPPTGVSSRRGKFGSGSGSSLASLVSLLKASGYVSGQTWANQATNPADGSVQSAHDWWLGRTSGAEGSDPAHTGGNRWVFSEGDRFTLAAVSIPAFYQNMHHAGRKFSLLFRISYDGSASGNPIPLFDSGTADFGGSYTCRGIAFCDFSGQFGPTHKVKLYVGRDSNGNAPSLSIASDASMPTGGVHTVGISFDSTGESASFLYLDGNYLQVSGADTFNGLLTTPGTSNSTLAPTLGGRADGFASSTTGTQLYGAALFNTRLTMQQMIAADALLSS